MFFDQDKVTELGSGTLTMYAIDLATHKIISFIVMNTWYHLNENIGVNLLMES